MYKIFVIKEKDNGKISFTKEELEKLLSEVYEEGVAHGKNYIHTEPFIPIDPYNPIKYKITCDTSDSNLNTCNKKCKGVM